MTETKEQDLRVERLVSGDRPSIYALGTYGAHAIKQSEMAVFMVDVLGRVHLMPPDSVQVLKRPRVLDEDLNVLSEEDAITTMVQQGDTETVIIEYLKRREEKGALHGGEDL